MSDARRAFVPGHLTGFFTVDRDDDPTRAGSRGAGITLTDGVTVSVRPAEERRIILGGEPASVEAVERVLGALDATAEVRAATDLPVGAGFGVSGAMALGTALAANAAFDRRLSTDELATIAHGAEVRAGTGLGDVVAQLRGGAPIRLEPGSPQHNAMDAIPARSRVEYVTFGDLSTASVIGDDATALSAAGERALSRLVQEPTLPTFVEASRTFSREADLLSDRVREAVIEVTEAGGDAAMGMLGETVFALGDGLSAAGYEPERCRIDPAGATLLAPAAAGTLPRARDDGSE